MNRMAKMRYCDKCKNFFITENKYSKRCPDCKKIIHQEIVMKNLFT